MPYLTRFTATDNLILHLNGIIATIPTHVQADYAGFLSVSAVTVYELAIKDIFYEFAEIKNKVFGVFVKKHFGSINGRITLGDLRGQHIKPFGEKYLTKFNKDFKKREDHNLRRIRTSVETCYTNLLICRHKYVHVGNVILSLPEAMKNYELGKEVIHSLDYAMRR